ncbi:hypothetical protein BT96DRAFT_969648 [Gymnopus androsaceus JB14]|uniref:Uncharacterized protein n=1 Tax=Gymnopus androsaceus JB14 TaxID=1447944 RepID=A0A6A4IGY5_9AGAR|nr:hypothetical protein BT96DRAFT_969648 [Gymnopus androsaceus JB14]
MDLGVSSSLLATRHRSDDGSGDTNPIPRSWSSPPRIETQIESSRLYTPWFQNILDESASAPTDINQQQEIEDLLDNLLESHLPMAWSRPIHLDEPEAEDYIGYRTNKQYCMEVLAFTLASDTGNTGAPRNPRASSGSNILNVGGICELGRGSGGEKEDEDEDEDEDGEEGGSSWVTVQPSRPKHSAFAASQRILVNLPRTQNSHKALSRDFQAAVLSLKNPPTLYSPFDEFDSSEAQIVSLYHGTTRSALELFYSFGVRPIWRPNQLSHVDCFYATPSLAQAFVHPLYTKRHRTDGRDPIVVLRFDVDLRVLHGLIDIPNTNSGASVKWYNASVEEQRKRFISIVAKNLQLSGITHHFVRRPVYDITIAPICLVAHGQPPTILPNWSNEQDGYLIQSGASWRSALTAYSENLNFEWALELESQVSESCE